MLAKLVQNHRYTKGVRVRKVTTALCGTISSVEYKASECQWHNDTPKHIEVEWDDGSITWHTVYEITKKKARP